GCIVNNERKQKKRGKRLIMKQLSRREGVKGPVGTLTNHRLPKAVLHLSQSVRSRIR
ncbi:hypothetical protein HN51_024212, partial [Arachis hypogaea]